MSSVSHEIDQDIGRLVLDVVDRKLANLDTRIDQSILDGELERTIDGASTLSFTVHDPHRALLQSGMFDHTIEVTLDGLHWRLVKVSKSDTDLTLTFEDREVSYLRENTKPRKASRAEMTRAEFVLSMVREVKKGGGIKFVCPDLHVTQPIQNDAQKVTPLHRKTMADPGINPNAGGLTVKGAAADASQIKLAEQALDVANSLGAPEKAMAALMEALIVESQIRNSGTYDDHDSRGILQIRDSTAHPMGIDNMDVAASVHAFLTEGFWGKGSALELVRLHPDWTAGQVAQQVQGSAYPSAYDQYAAEAQNWVDAYTGGDITKASDSATTERVVKLPFQFRRGQEDGTPETSWDAIQRLAQEVNWRAFMNRGTLYFISEETLMKSKPALVLTETTAGVNTIDFDIDEGKVRDSVTVTCRAARWLAAPGAVVVLDQVGPANGRWLVSNLHRGLFDANATITLTRAQKPIPEPAAETQTVTTGGTGSVLAGGTTDTTSPGGGATAGLQLPENFTHTHDTAGLPGYPAIDVMAPAGTLVGAPADGEVVQLSGRPWSDGWSDGPGSAIGLSIYIRTSSGEYFLTHFDQVYVTQGQHVTRGQVIGRVGPMVGPPPHIHEGFTGAR